MQALYRLALPPDTTKLSEKAISLSVTDLNTKARKIYEGVLEHRDDIDQTITEVSHHWRLSRMAVLDKTVLRVAVFELKYRPATPTGVIISEAVRIAQRYGAEQSGRFVNGVLSGAAKLIRLGEPFLKEQPH